MTTDKFVCFTCRKAFAKRSIVGRAVAEKPSYSCGDCGGVLFYAGPKYQAPRRSAVGDWALDQALAEQELFACSPRFVHGVHPSQKIHSLRELEIRRRTPK